VYELSRKRIWLFVLLIPFLLFGYFCYDYIRLDVYSNTKDNEITFNNNRYIIATGDNKDEFYNYDGNRVFEIGNAIGKSTDSHLFGFKETIWEIEGISTKEAIFMKGLMIEGVFIKKE
jgi:hypothetical protein